MPARVLLQDFTGVPAVVDLAAMRDAMEAPGRRSRSASTRCSPPSWSSTTRCRSMTSARRRPSASNAAIEFERNQRALRLPALGPDRPSRTSRSCRPTPASSTRSTSNTWRAPCSRQQKDGIARPTPTPLVGTDSHTTMINGLGVLGWGVGGIEAEAAMLGQPVSMLIPRGRRLQAHRPAARGRDGHRPGPHRHPDAAQEGRGRQVRRVLRRRPGPPAAGRPRHHRQHGPRVRRHLRHLPRRRRDARPTCASPAAAPSRWRWSRPTPRSRACSAHRAHPRRVYTRHAGARPGHGRARRWPAPAAAGPRRLEGRQGRVEKPDVYRKQARARRARTATWTASERGRRHSGGRGGGPSQRRRDDRDRRARRGVEARLRRDRRHHQLHQHVQPVGHDRRRAAGQEGASSAGFEPSRGSRPASPRLARWSPTT